jgi:hypothetical protein
VDNQELKQVFQDLWRAIQAHDDEAEQALRVRLAQQGWFQEQMIMFVLEELAQDAMQASRQRERTSRRNAVTVSFLVAIPTLVVSVGFQKLALANDYFILAQLERWYGGIVVGALSSLAVSDYRVWLEADLTAKNLSTVDSAKMLRVWSRQRWQQKLEIFARPAILRSKAEHLAIVEGEALAMWQQTSSSKQLQGYLLLRLSQRGWSDFWEAVDFEKNLGPSRFFLVIAMFCAFLVSFDSLSAGISAGVAAYILAEWMVPFLSVSNIYFPTLLSGVDTGQSSNISAALRVLVVTGFMVAVVLLELWFQQLGLPRLRFLNLF